MVNDGGEATAAAPEGEEEEETEPATMCSTAAPSSVRFDPCSPSGAGGPTVAVPVASGTLRTTAVTGTLALAGNKVGPTGAVVRCWLACWTGSPVARMTATGAGAASPCDAGSGAGTSGSAMPPREAISAARAASAGKAAKMAGGG